MIHWSLPPLLLIISLFLVCGCSQTATQQDQNPVPVAPTISDLTLLTTPQTTVSSLPQETFSAQPDIPVAPSNLQSIPIPAQSQDPLIGIWTLQDVNGYSCTITVNNDGTGTANCYAENVIPVASRSFTWVDNGLENIEQRDLYSYTLTDTTSNISYNASYDFSTGVISSTMFQGQAEMTRTGS